MALLTVAICTFNRAERLPRLVAELNQQECPVQFEILIINNNSTDNTDEILEKLDQQYHDRLRYVVETRQGIVYARNRAIEESCDSDFLVFMDDDELPRPGLLMAAVNALVDEGADCAGGRVKVSFGDYVRPGWLGDDLLGFLAEVDYGAQAFWIEDTSTPLWTANIAYRASLFDNGLRFDNRYNRAGTEIGGGEDAIMFRSLLGGKAKIRYRPDMIVDHFVEAWRLKIRYFLRLHYKAGVRFGRYEMEDYPGTFMGVPPFMINQLIRQIGRVMFKLLRREPGVVRQSMNAAHACGSIVGRICSWRDH